MRSDNTGPPERPARPAEISFGKAAVGRVRAGFIDGDDRLHGLRQRRRQSELWAARLPGGRSQRHSIAVFTKNTDGYYVSADPIGPNGGSGYMLATPRAVRGSGYDTTPGRRLAVRHSSCRRRRLPDLPRPSQRSARVLKDRPEAVFLFGRGFSREWATSVISGHPCFTSSLRRARGFQIIICATA